jgi:hypothetical protein
MSNPRQSRARDVAIRLAGLAMLPAGAVSIDLLYHLANATPAHEAAAAELVLAALGFLCLSIGSALLALGLHIFDEVEISARWADRG